MHPFLARLQADVDAVIANDPAARGRWYVGLTYPGLHAVWSHRVANALWRRGLRLPAQALSMLTRSVTGVEIHPGATIGHRFVIDHGMGVVIGETARVGDDVLLYHGVTLGARSRRGGPRHPVVGDGVVIGTGATLLGRIHVGDGARIGAQSLVTHDVAPGALVVADPDSERLRRVA